jgi:hypothetical protein
MTLAEARAIARAALGERIVKNRRPGSPSIIIDLDDDPLTLGREFQKIEHEWRLSMMADRRKFGPPTPGSDDEKIETMYVKMLDAFAEFGIKLVAIGNKYKVKHPEPKNPWA